MPAEGMTTLCFKVLGILTADGEMDRTKREGTVEVPLNIPFKEQIRRGAVVASLEMTHPKGVKSVSLRFGPQVCLVAFTKDGTDVEMWVSHEGGRA